MNKMGRYWLILLVLIAPQLLAGTVYYAATNGNDSYNGLYPSYQSGSNGPFRTLGKAAATVHAGDTVKIRGGTYQEASTWSTNGTRDNPITVTNYSGETPIINGNSHTIPGNEYGVLLIIYGDWYTVSNLEISFSSGYGLTVAAGADYCTVDNIYVHHNWTGGIVFSGWYGLANNCRAYNNSLRHEYGAGPNWGTGISACRYPQHTTLRGCTAWDNWGEGISTFETYYITIEDCVAYNNQINFYLSDTRFALFQRNISYYTPGNMIQNYYTQSAIMMGDETHVPASSDNTVINNFALGGERNFAAEGDVLINCLIANNTFVNADAHGDCNVLIYAGTSASSRFTNNIILQEDSLPIAINATAGLSFSYNNWSRLPVSSARGTGDVTGNPMVAKTGPTGPGLLTPGWFKILDNSLAQDRAQVLSQVKEDYFKTPRAGAPDMGGHEFSYGTSPLTASATGSPTAGQAPLSVNFTGSASGGTSPYSYRWTFGDGGSSNSQNPSHTYSSAGSYTATLTVTDSVSATATSTVNINVTAGVPLSANIAASPTSGQAPLTVNFTGSATGGNPPYSYRWTFGDGGSSTSQNPSHTYSSAGSYTATLTVTDSQSATNSKSLTITVTSAPAQLVATASASPTSGQAPLTVNFTGSATGGTSPYSYRWTFGDGGSSTTQNPSHTYSSAGSYAATLTVTDSQSATNSKSLTITVTSAPAQLVATASASPTSGQAPLTVNFTGSATGGAPPYSYSWNFGDGSTSSTQNPSYTYTAEGTYTATLTVADSVSANASASIDINVTTTTSANLALAAQTGAPAPGQGGTTDPSPGTHSFPIGSSVQAKSIPNTDYRFSKWDGDVAPSSTFNSEISITMDNNKSLSSTFCTKCADVNGDLRITPADAQLAFDIYLGRVSNATWCELENADVKCDGTKLSPKITPADAQTIFNKYLRRGVGSGDCSGNSRTEAASMLNLALPAVKLAINKSAFNQGEDIYMPIIVESPSEIGAFGFDLLFPSNQLTFIGLERTELTNDFDQLDANVIPYLIPPDERKSAQASGLLREPLDGFDQQPANMNASILRIGGYKTKSTASPSSGVLITLIFRVSGEVKDSSSISIIATYDDIQNASLIDGTPIPKTSSAERPARQSAPEKRLSGKRYEY